MSKQLLGIEGGAIIIENLEVMHGKWIAEFLEGDQWYNDCGRRMNRVIARFEKDNLIVTNGKGLTLDRIFGLSSVIALAGTAVGTSATAAAVGDTAITGAVYKAFASTPTRSSLTVTALTSYLTSEANISIQEAGLLTASAGVLFNRVAPFASFTKTTSFSLDITTAVTQS